MPIKGVSIQEEEISAFDESNLPYVVNLSYNVEDSFYKLIEKDLVKIERKKDDA